MPETIDKVLDTSLVFICFIWNLLTSFFLEADLLQTFGKDVFTLM